jgi:hypothetical protein
LVLYNFLTLCGWAWALKNVYDAASFDCSAESKGIDIVPAWFPASPLNNRICVFGEGGPDGKALLEVLKIVQTPAILEFFHAVFKLVSSKPSVVFQQVLSRIVQVWFILYLSPDETTQMSALWLMAFAWSLTEVIRSTLYTLKQLGLPAPYILEWCRLSFFIVLYPCGVYGENWTQLAAATSIVAGPKASILYKWTVYLALCAYPIFFPGLYMHMFKQRAKFMKSGGKPAEKKDAKPADRGTQFPFEGEKRSTSVTGAKIHAAAFKASSDPETQALAEPCEKAGKKWRFGYLKHLKKLVYASLKSPEEAVTMSKAALDYIYANFRFFGADGKETSFAEEMETLTAKYNVGVINGEGAKYDGVFTVPYKKGTISGDGLKKQCDAWAKYGTIEQDCADAIKMVVDDPTLTDLKGKIFVMLGAGSAMGPFPKLMELGATVVALDIPGNWGIGSKRPSSGCWKRLVEIARKSPGKLIFPLSKPQADCKDDMDMFQCSGANLMEEPSEILEFLLKKDVIGGDQKATIGNYTYLNSDLHVKLSLCSDAIMKGLIAKKGKDISIAFLCTPTDLHVIPAEATKAMKANASPLANPPAWILNQVIRLLTGGNYLKPNAQKKAANDINLVNGISVAQGPNYALAKRMQHWRAVLAYEEGITVASNIAPSTATISVLQNKMFALAYQGMPFYAPYEIFEQDTTNAVMAAMLFHDVFNTKGPAYPANRKEFKINNAYELFKYGSFHGGLWRAAYTVDSIGLPSIIVACLGGPTIFVPVAYALLSGLGYFFQSDTFLQSGFVNDMTTLAGM